MKKFEIVFINNEKQIMEAKMMKKSKVSEEYLFYDDSAAAKIIARCPISNVCFIRQINN